MDVDAEGELRNPFPSPPSIYTNYTSHNLRLLSILKSRQTVTDASDDTALVNQQDILSDQKDVPSSDLRSLEPPRVDWILEEGHYDVFGDKWHVDERFQSLAEAGVKQLYPSDASVDRRAHLQAVLRTLLDSYLKLLSATGQPPPTTSAYVDGVEPTKDWQHHLGWLHTLSLNLMAAANDMRPAQARANVEGLLRRQLDLRREETKKLHARCDALEQTLATLQKQSSHTLSSNGAAAAVLESTELDPMTSAGHAIMILDNSPLSKEDVYAWADGVD
ncbi:MED7 protein-domain-containing protein [Auriculariales sp. MPI-PUGE-AT-0066]|nr:MED7 protein-domain-containing protein [Auriculariales sp. MPI-PUGE-AT-0066]